MYCHHFNLDHNPFAITPDPRYLFLGKQHREALAHLLYGIEVGGGFILLTGEVGTGKTTLCRTLIEQLPSAVDLALIINPRLDSLELLAAIADELQLPLPPLAERTIGELIRQLHHHLLATHAAGRRTVVMIDEAQNLTPEVLEQVRLLSNLETSQDKLLQLFLVGQPELRQLLQRDDLRQVAQRITARYHIEPLTRSESSAYIDHRCAVAGARRPLLSRSAKWLVFRLTAGTPRLINLLCDRALLGAYAAGRSRAGWREVARAGSELAYPLPTPYRRRWRERLAIVATAIGLIIAVSHVDQWRRAPPPTAASPIALERPTLAAPAAASIDSAAIAPMQPPRSANTAAPPLTSYRQASAQLLAQWQLPDEGRSLCLQAVQRKLRCYNGSGGWRSLRQLDRPALIRRITATGDIDFLTVVALDAAQVTLLNGAGEAEILPLQALEREWQGDFTLLWRPPVTATLLRRGDRGEAVRQLRQYLGLTESDRYDAVTEQAVRQFQRQLQLQVDGISGAETLRYLQARDPRGPHLQPQSSAE